MFCTLWMGILEISTGKVIEVNAGHENPVIYRKGIGYEERKTKHNIALATMPGIKYKNHEFELGVGDTARISLKEGTALQITDGSCTIAPAQKSRSERPGKMTTGAVPNEGPSLLLPFYNMFNENKTK